MDELDKTCLCGHTGHEHDAGECWAVVAEGPAGTLQCDCNWWEPRD